MAYIWSACQKQHLVKQQRKFWLIHSDILDSKNTHTLENNGLEFCTQSSSHKQFENKTIISKKGKSIHCIQKQWCLLCSATKSV